MVGRRGAVKRLMENQNNFKVSKRFNKKLVNIV